VFITAHTRRHSWLGMIVLLAVLATLLPPQRVSAQTIPPFPIINMTREELNEHIYLAWSRSRTSHGKKGTFAERQIQALLVADQLLSDASLYDADVIIKQAEALHERYIQRLGPRGADPAYRDSLPMSTVSEAVLTAALETPVFRDDVRRVYDRIRKVATASLSDPDHKVIGPATRAFYKTITDQNVLSNAYGTLLDEKLEQGAKRANAKAFVKAWDATIGTLFGVKLEGFDAKTFIAEHPGAVPSEIENAIRPDGSLEISLEDLNKLALQEFGKINASIDDMQKTLVSITKQQGELVAFMKDQQKRQALQEQADAKDKQHKLLIDAATSSVSIISTLVGFKNPKLAKQISTVGQSLIKIGDSVRSYLKTVSTLSTLGASLSTVVMTGNVLGAVMSIVSLFGPQEPPIEQTILEEIGKLRQQVNELRVEMHTRFDQVDKQLNTIYTTMHERFNQIDIQLGKINGSLAEIQQSLLTLSLALNRMERNNFEYFDALGRRPLREALNGALGYKQRTGLDMPYQPDFVNYENFFHTWGTVNALDSLSAGPAQRDYSDAAVLGELNAAPLDANLNYLNGWLVAHGMQPFANKRLASPRDWTFASRAYADLGLEWPEHFRRIDPQRQAALDAVGKDLELAMQNISTMLTPNGPQGNGPLFTALTSYYNAKLEALDGALVQSEAAYVKDLQNQLDRTTPFDLYGGLDQSLASRPADFKTMSCGGQVPEPFATPNNLKNAVPNYNRVALADYLAVTPLLVCSYAYLTDQFEFCQPTKPTACEPYATPLVQISVRSNSVELVKVTTKGFPVPVSGGVQAVLIRHWDTYFKPKFEKELETPALAEAQALAPAALQQLENVDGELAGKLAELQRVYASRVLGELNRGPLQARTVELAGAKKLFESFVTLGFQRAINDDDFMRSLLFGNESLVDDQQVALAYATPLSTTLAATQAISEAQLTVNPRVELLETGLKRREALGNLLSDYLGNISTENYAEDSALIGNTRFDMVLARAFANPGAPLPPAPGQSRALFLPLLRR
jgi:hypothetical protein